MLVSHWDPIIPHLRASSILAVRVCYASNNSRVWVMRRNSQGTMTMCDNDANPDIRGTYRLSLSCVEKSDMSDKLRYLTIVVFSVE